jgi:hypothetical protein
MGCRIPPRGFAGTTSTRISGERYDAAVSALRTVPAHSARRPSRGKSPSAAPTTRTTARLAEPERLRSSLPVKRRCSSAPVASTRPSTFTAAPASGLGGSPDRAAREEPRRPGPPALLCALPTNVRRPGERPIDGRSRGRMRRTRSRSSHRRARRLARQGRAPPGCGRPHRRSHRRSMLARGGDSTFMAPSFAWSGLHTGLNRHRCRYAQPCGFLRNWNRGAP